MRRAFIFARTDCVKGLNQVATKPATEARIFDGALHALARQGPKKLAMSDIASEAGVSVGTLYRYFKNKDVLLKALGDHFVSKLRSLLQSEIEADSDPANRLNIVVDVMLRFWLDNPATMRIGQVEPGWVLNYIKSVVPQLSEVLKEALSPVLGDSAAVVSGLATLDEVVDLIVRVAVAHYFMPSADYQELRDLVVALGAAAGLEPNRARARKGRTAAS